MSNDVNKVDNIESDQNNNERRKRYENMAYEDLENEFIKELKALPTEQSNRFFAMAIKSVSPDDAEEIGENIKIMRRVRHLKQSDPADAIGISKTIISRYERGEACPSMERLLQIAEVLDIPLYTLISVSSEEDSSDETLYEKKPNKLDLLRDLALAAGYKVSITDNYKDKNPLDIDFSIIADNESFLVTTYDINDFYSQVVDYFSFIVFRWLKEQMHGEED